MKDCVRSILGKQILFVMTKNFDAPIRKQKFETVHDLKSLNSRLPAVYAVPVCISFVDVFVFIRIITERINGRLNYSKTFEFFFTNKHLRICT